MENKIKIIAIVGPTASGKTGLSVQLAKRFNAEIISCDSMQIYKGMNIGTAKVTKEEMQGIEHHLIDFLEPTEDFSVSDYVSLADKKIKEIHEKGKIPMIVGGTGLYLRSLLYGVNFKENSRDDSIREKLEKEIEQGKSQELFDKLVLLDPKASEIIHINNKKRLVRALEYCLVTGEKFSEQSVISESKYDFCLIGLNFKDREKLYERINKRVDMMLSMGLVEEAEKYFGTETKTSAQAIGYKELFPCFKGEISFEEAAENIKRETRRYAKRQITWFKSEKGINWVYIDDEKNLVEITEKTINNFIGGEII
ncbi:MAG: tRNA (adenosine(37)-N6)-dimethylallyltransferase MiaA [Clostridia bacterium]